MAEKDFKLSIGVDASELTAGLTAATEAVTESAAAMSEALTSVTDAFGLLSQAAVALASVMAGGKVFKDMVASTVNLNVESMELGKQFGISATQASILKVALDATYLTQDQLAAAGARMTRTLNTNEGAFKELGVATRDSNGNFRSMLDIMLDVNEKLLEFKEGTDRNRDGPQIYGRGWQEVSQVLRLTVPAMEEAKVKADALNLTVGQESEADTARYRAATVALHDVLRGISVTIGQALLPSLTSLGNWFQSEGPTAIEGTRSALAGIVSMFALLRQEVKNEVDFIIGEFYSLVVEIKGDAAAINEALHFNWAAAKADLKEKTDEQKGVYQTYLDDLVQNQKQAADLMAATTQKMFQVQTPTAPPAGDKTSEGGVDQFSKRLDSWLKELDLEYAALKKQHEAEMEVYKQQEAEFKNAAAARIAIAEQEVAAEMLAYGQGSPQYEAAQKHLIEIQQQANAQLRQMADAFAATDRARQEAAIAADEKMLQDKFNNHLISNAQLEAGELALEDRKTAIAAAGVKDRMALIDPTHDPVEYAKLCAQLEQIESQHQARITAIQQQAYQNNNKLFETMYKSMESGFSQAISGLLKGTETFQQAMQQMCKAILDAIINFLAQWVTQWATTQIANMVASKTAAVSSVASQAGVAGAAGVASFAQAPWPVDLGAPAFGAAMESSALAFGATASAAGGYDIPVGVAPRMQLHPKEMVLPQAIADPLREMIASGRKGSGGTTSLHVAAMDGRSVQRVLTRNASGVTKAMQRIHQNVVR